MTRLGGFIAIAGVVLFLVAVAALHLLQPAYDPVNQLMSELALGPHGGAMVAAFAGIAAALGTLAWTLGRLGAGVALRLMLATAAAFFLAAGIFPLGETSTLHIAAIAAAFVFAVLAMYLYPSLAGPRAPFRGRALSWALAAGVAASVALGHSMLPMGIGQRAAAACLLSWILVIGVGLARSKG